MSSKMEDETVDCLVVPVLISENYDISISTNAAKASEDNCMQRNHKLKKNEHVPLSCAKVYVLVKIRDNAIIM